MSAVFIIFAIGLGAGILSGLLGIGGGAVLVPMMVFILGITQHTAQGISMLVIIPTALVSVWHFHKDKLIHYQAVLYLAGGAIVGALISSNLVQHIPASELKRIFGIFVIYSGFKMIWGTRKK
ncbi:sulfite exporter TauE/SafE family protein [Sporomusa sphaeroides]|uniref:Probable membrane transporter protein n=2 Tax=Sporomusa TaxID=2375 RepID=A0ABM9VZV1_9FIRM|nr:sulfite exporter TauE/SafE family protein [Sporomusa sphaeroides]OLS58247.1 sulfite exporter TauE/SafE [Sporomusa sphaeroides DSM 2875]CVK17566.1 Sulfite exporter TauE/SafE [Sporomusa sphaeroides DSM 2875]SCM80373.1 putative permease [uncultured Sporomusa sp.]